METRDFGGSRNLGHSKRSLGVLDARARMGEMGEMETTEVNPAFHGTFTTKIATVTTLGDASTSVRQTETAKY